MLGIRGHVHAAKDAVADETSNLLPKFSSAAPGSVESPVYTLSTTPSGDDPVQVRGVNSLISYTDNLAGTAHFSESNGMLHTRRPCMAEKAMLMMPLRQHACVPLRHYQMESKNSTGSLCNRALMGRLCSEKWTTTSCLSFSAWLFCAVLTVVSH